MRTRKTIIPRTIITEESLICTQEQKAKPPSSSEKTKPQEKNKTQNCNLLTDAESSKTKDKTEKQEPKIEPLKAQLEQDWLFFPL